MKFDVDEIGYGASFIDSGVLWEQGDQKEHDYLTQVNAKNRQLAATGEAGTGSIAEVARIPVGRNESEELVYAE